MSKKIGRPSLNNWSKSQIVHKLEPYLKMGLSIKKACRESGVPSSTVYKYMHIDEDFMGEIYRFQQYISVMTGVITTRIMFRIIQKQEKGIELKNHEMKYMMWLATNSKLTSEEFWHSGEHVVVATFDPEIELRRLNKLIEESLQEPDYDT